MNNRTPQTGARMGSTVRLISAAAVILALTGCERTESPPAGMRYVRLSSGLFSYAQYAPASKNLYLRFSSGPTYQYEQVPEDIVEGFVRAESKGEYFNRHIRGQFPFTVIPDNLLAGY